jgi:hypothetical protein
MAGAARIVKGIVLLAVAALVALTCSGTYTALDVVSGGYVQDGFVTARGELSVGAGGQAGDGTQDDAATSTGGLALDAGTSVLPSGAGSLGNAEDSRGSVAAPSTSGSSGGSEASASQGSTSTSSPNQNPNSGPVSGSVPSGPNVPVPSPSAPPATTESQKTYHPAWDEWVEEGHWEESVRAATYGERPVYGAVCNQCGQIIVGNPNQHLKDTHHSGWHEDVVGYETYEITPAKTERVWVDTSHWIHHPESWS